MPINYANNLRQEGVDAVSGKVSQEDPVRYS